MRSSWSDHSHLLVLFLLTILSFSIFDFKEYNQSDFSVDHLVVSICRVFSWKRVFAMTMCSLAKTLLAFVLLHFVLQGNLPVTLGVSWLTAFAFQSPIMKRTSLLVLVLRGLVGLHRTVQLQLLQHYLSGHRLRLPWYGMVCFGNEERSFCCFWDCIQVLHFRLFCWLWWLLHFFKGILVHSNRYNGHLS